MRPLRHQIEVVRGRRWVAQKQVWRENDRAALLCDLKN